MIPRERFLTAISHKEPDRVPQLIRLGKEMERKLGRIYGVTGPELDIRLGNDAIVCRLGINSEMEMNIGDLVEGETYTNEWGVQYKRLSGLNYPVGHPLRDKINLRNYALPNPREPLKIEKLKTLIRGYGNNFAIVADLSSNLFEIAAGHLRGMEQFLMDCHEDPDFVCELLERLADHHSILGVMAVEAGADVIRIGDDVGAQKGMLIHPRLWRRLIRPRLFRLIQTFKQANPDIIILYHSCGDFSPIIPDLIDLGVHMISSMQEVGSMKLSKIKKDYGQTLSFKGGLDTQYLLPRGTPEQVREGVRRLVSTLGVGGGYVFMPAHLLYDDVPFQNIWAMIEALKDYGSYPLEKKRTKVRRHDAVTSAKKKEDIEAIAAMVEKGEYLDIAGVIQSLLRRRIGARNILIHGLHEGVQRLITKFKTGDAFIPEILTGNRAFLTGIKVLRPYFSDFTEEPKGVVVLGMVRNEFHEMGKNLVRIMLEAAGFRVIDLGANVSPGDFVSTVEKLGADILALSSRMSSTLTEMSVVIELLKQKGLRNRVKVMVGGAPVTEEYAKEIGADGFAPDAARAVDEAMGLLANQSSAHREGGAIMADFL